MALTIENAPGTKAALVKLRAMGGDTERALRHALFDTGRDFMKEIGQQVKGSKGGTKYKALRRRSSAPGESHASQSGKLLKSAGWKVQGFESITVGFGVDKKAPEHAKFVEFGTRNMSSRPTVQNTVAALERNIVVNIEQALLEELQ